MIDDANRLMNDGSELLAMQRTPDGKMHVDATCTGEETTDLSSTERTRIIATLLATQLPQHVKQDLPAQVAVRAGEEIIGITGGGHGLACSGLENFSTDLADLADIIDSASVPNEQMSEYLFNIFQVEYAMRSPTSTSTPTNGRSDVVDLHLASLITCFFSTLDRARFGVRIVTRWKQRFIEGVNDDTVVAGRMVHLKYIMCDFALLFKAQQGDEPQDNMRRADEISEAVMEAYSVSYFLSPKASLLREAFLRTISNIMVGSHDPDQVRIAIKILEAIPIQNIDPELADQFMDIVGQYWQNHPVTEDAIQGLGGSLLRAMLEKNPQVDVLQRPNIWAKRKGEFGIADFLCHCFATRLSPPKLNELLLAVRETPTTDFARFEQNRLDALCLDSPFGRLRDLIHDQRPLVHDVLQKMVEYYYNARRCNALKAVLARTDYLSSPECITVILDRSRYDQVVKEIDTKRKIKVIDLLRRLVENTRPVMEIPPITSDPDLNAKLVAVAEQKGKGGVSDEAFTNAVNHVNEVMLRGMTSGEVGIEPNLVLAIAWIERQCFMKLQNLTFERASSVHTAPWFRSILQFQELTASPNNFDPKEFERFLSSLDEAGSGESASSLIRQRVMNHVYALAKIYIAIGKAERTGALWSGNVAHELMLPSAMRRAETIVGERYQKEQSVPHCMRSTGD